jgi:hypothetical protein
MVVQTIRLLWTGSQMYAISDVVPYM